MSVTFDIVLWFCVGFMVGMLLMAYASMKDRKEIEERRDEMLRMAKSELDDTTERAEKAEAELIVKQNIIDSLAAKIQRQQKTIDKQKKMLKS